MMYINSCLKELQYDIDVEKYPHTSEMSGMIFTIFTPYFRVFMFLIFGCLWLPYTFV